MIDIERTKNMKIETIDKMTKAIEVAATAHEGQLRKSTGIPYISHPYMVGALLLQANCSTNVVISGYLHDGLEDTSLTRNDILLEFGSEVLAIVEGCSEPDKSNSWEFRKKHTINYLQAEATPEVLQVTCADKLHNLRSMHNQYQLDGENMWRHFNRGKAEQKWYYQELIHVLGERIGEFELYGLLKDEVEKVFTLK